MKLLGAIGATILASVIAPAIAQSVQKPLPTIAVSGGRLAGMVLPSGVKAWYGIPFAKPPVLDLRWQRPQPMSWTGVWNADRMGPECIQVLRPHKINHYFGEEPTSENCLYMNVWAPANARAGAKLPVIVFIYGGGSTIGSSATPTYAGEAVAKRGAVFVNFNYRLGILGFMAHPELSREQGGHSGNYAYLDQNAALRWIHDNIDKFGGDPAKVLIMGQSAGAGSVIQQIHSPLSKGLFRAAVMSSGCNFGSTGGTTLQQGEQTGLDIQRRLGVANISEMRDVPADRLLALQAESQVGVSVQGVRVGGIIDGYFMPATQLAIAQAHAMNDVPIIASFNSGEASNALAQAKTAAEYRAMAYRLYGDKAPEFLRLYPVASDADVAPMAAAAAREAGLENNARKCGQIMNEYNKSPAYITMFAKKHSYAPGVKIADQDPATIGAYHTADIPYYFGTLDAFNLVRPTREWTAYDRELSRKMMDSLIALAGTGNPSTREVKWPAWTPQDERKVVFGTDVSVQPLHTDGLAFLAANPAYSVALPSGPARTGPRD